MILLVIFIALVIASLDASPTRNDGCSVSLNEDLSDPEPLILVKKGLDVDFVNPIDTSGTLSFKKNEEFRLACPGAHNYLVGVGENDVQDIAAFCVRGKTFRVNSVKYEFGDLVCKTLPLNVVRRTGNRCLGNHSEIEIGFVLKDDFLKTIEICRDDSIYATLYAKFNLTKSIGGSQKSYARPSWHQSKNLWGPYKVNSLYARDFQTTAVSEILNSTKLGDKYISSTSNYYLARGHLVAKADFVYGSAHCSTFWYINTFPQWQTFNAANWMCLEQNVRSFASDMQLDLDVYTGTHGIMTLPDVNNVEQKLYLYASGKDRALAIPLFFWKIIYDPITQTGTAFVGVNNPYITDLTEDYYICEDISSEISWLTWHPDDISRGISYACTVDDLRKVVPTLPELNVVDVLI